MFTTMIVVDQAKNLVNAIRSFNECCKFMIISKCTLLLDVNLDVMMSTLPSVVHITQRVQSFITS